MTKKIKVCLLTSVHPSAFDIRIFYREAKTLVAAGYEVSLIVQHDRAEVVDSVKIIPLPRPRNRFDRMTRVIGKLFWLAFKQRADVYHFHDPELILVGLFFKFFFKTKVIYDVHEVFGEKILLKEWINPALRPLVSNVVTLFERLTSKYFDHIIIVDRSMFKSFHQKNVTVVANYPLLSLVKRVSAKEKPIVHQDGKTIAIYVGVLTKDRGLIQMIEAVKRVSNLDIELHLIGHFGNSVDHGMIKDMEHVKYFGFLPLDKVFERLRTANIGLALFQPVPAHLYAGDGSNKFFEYMAFELPLVVSNFHNLRTFIERYQCGLCVDPTCPQEIATAIRFLHEHPHIRAEMGRNGRQAILKEYNWEKESQRLLSVYHHFEVAITKT